MPRKATGRSGGRPKTDFDAPVLILDMRAREIRVAGHDTKKIPVRGLAWWLPWVEAEAELVVQRDQLPTAAEIFLHFKHAWAEDGNLRPGRDWLAEAQAASGKLSKMRRDPRYQREVAAKVAGLRLIQAQNAADPPKAAAHAASVEATIRQAILQISRSKARKSKG